MKVPLLSRPLTSARLVSGRLFTNGRRRGFMTSKSFHLSNPIDVAEQALVSIHVHTGAPWWATIAGTAVAVRVALLPTLWYQLRETKRFVALRPQLIAIRQEVNRIEPQAARVSTLLRRMYSCCRQAGVQPLVVFGMVSHRCLLPHMHPAIPPSALPSRACLAALCTVTSPGRCAHHCEAAPHPRQTSLSLAPYGRARLVYRPLAPRRLRRAPLHLPHPPRSQPAVFVLGFG